MSRCDKAAILAEARRLVPDAQTVALTGSASFEGRHFRPGSDFDVIAIGPRNCFAWGEVGGTEVELVVFTQQKVWNLVGNPHWSGAGWIWLAGKIGGAEILDGPPLEAAIRAQITPEARLTAVAGLIGQLLLGAEKWAGGRRSLTLDVPLALSALRHIIHDRLPVRCAADEDLHEMNWTSDFSAELAAARLWSRQAAGILEDDRAVGRIMYYPEQRAGLRWLRRGLGIDRPMPDLCLHP